MNTYMLKLSIIILTSNRRYAIMISDITLCISNAFLRIMNNKVAILFLHIFVQCFQ